MNILITAMGSVTAQSVAKALNNGEHTIIGTDALPRSENVGSFFCDKYYTLPLARYNDAYIGMLDHIIREECIRLVIPCSDIEAQVIAENIYRLPQDVFINAIQLEGVRIANDKWLTYQFFKKIDVPTPETIFADDIYNDKNIKKGIYKERFGVGSKGIWYSVNSLIGAGRDTEDEDILYQEKLEGKEFTVDVYVGVKGMIAAVPRWRLVVRDGKSYKCDIFKDDRLRVYCKFITHHLGLLGIYNIQGFYNDGVFKFTEINCRPSATLVSTTLAGVNMPLMLVKELNGFIHDKEITDYKTIRVLRYWDERVVT